MLFFPENHLKNKLSHMRNLLAVYIQYSFDCFQRNIQIYEQVDTHSPFEMKTFSTISTFRQSCIPQFLGGVRLYLPIRICIQFTTALPAQLVSGIREYLAGQPHAHSHSQPRYFAIFIAMSVRSHSIVSKSSPSTYI